MINSNRILEKKRFPYPYIIIQNFFEKEFYKNIENDFPKKESFSDYPNNLKRMNFDTTYGDEFYSKLISKSETFRLLHNFIYGDKFIKMFLDLFGEDIKNEIGQGFLKSDVKNLPLNKNPYEVKKIFGKHNFKKENNVFLYPRLDIGLGEVGYGINTGGKGIHIDNPQRVISILFYAGGYTKIDGGEHRIWKKTGDKIEIERIIQPKPNLLIASLQNNMSFHDVNPIKKISGTRNAFYMAISCSSAVWKNIKVNDFNLKYNKNRCKLNLLSKLKKYFRKFFF